TLSCKLKRQLVVMVLFFVIFCESMLLTSLSLCLQGVCREAGRSLGAGLPAHLQLVLSNQPAT
ncbi:hypothetical protein P7M35_25100, partial [Vibrio parahaemolyticus]|nr:hypothetical protein [Vibrio parahaemolyticus]